MLTQQARAILTVCGAVAMVAANLAHAQSTFPNRVVRIIVPSTSGGDGDALARLLTHHFTERWGKQVIVENRTGASNMLGGGAMVIGANGEQFAAFIKSETVKWARVVEAAGIIPE